MDQADEQDGTDRENRPDGPVEDSAGGGPDQVNGSDKPYFELPARGEALLSRFLPLYADARERWPLWTYERRRADHERETSPDRPLPHPTAVEYALGKLQTWHNTSCWIDRLAWSPVSRCRQLWLSLDSHFKPILPFELAVWEFGCSEAYVTLQAPGEGLGSDAGRKAFYKQYGVDRMVPVPQRLRLEDAAVSAQYAQTVPGQMREVVPLVIHSSGVEDADIHELLADLGRELTAPRPWPGSGRERWLTTSSVGRRRGESELEFLRRLTATQKLADEPYVSLLALMLHAELPEAARLGAAIDKSTEQLATELFRRVGLAPSREGGAKTRLRRGRVFQLYQEAVSIVKEVRRRVHQDDDVEAMIQLIEEDPFDELAHTERERIRRGEYSKAPHLFRTLRRLRFPFLLDEEFDTILRKEPIRSTARRLVMGRLRGFDAARDDGVLQVEYLTPGRQEHGRIEDSPPAKELPPDLQRFLSSYPDLDPSS